MKFATAHLIALVCWLSSFSFTPAKESSHDLVIYGGTSAGIAAGIQASRMDMSVVIIEPTNRLGGLTTGGLGQTDIGRKHVIGGISREFYQGVRKHYENPANWRWQKRKDYKSGGQSRTKDGEDAMWTFEPSAAMAIYAQMMEGETIDIEFGQRLNRKDGVKKESGRITSITMESGEIYSGKMFIDATYEGDLLAAAGVSYTVGRESNSKYGESLNGVQDNITAKSLIGTESRNAKHHNFVKGVDPYVTPGDPKSGLLPFINPDGPGESGSGDRKVQAYCFRMTLTDHPENRIPFRKPEGYKEIEYELMFRNFEAGFNQMPWINSPMPNRKTDTNNRTGFSTDFIGGNYDYPEASYEEREKIVARHRHYQQGLMWALANHPRVPENIRKEVSRWGTCKDEYESPDGWQQQLYIREARRMVSDFVMTQKHCEGLEAISDPVGMGAYNMDSHHVQRYVSKTGVQNEGNVECPLKQPYQISYRSIRPKREECTNLLVPVCVSSSHIAFGSIRMEPVFMILAQSAATAAKLAIDSGTAVQDIDYAELRKILIKDKQILEEPK